MPTWSAEDLDTRIVETVRALSDIIRAMTAVSGGQFAQYPEDRGAAIPIMPMCPSTK
ncbi:MAG: hypothetical protein R2857_07245 [Vampirovibrionales bacterium]